MSLKSRQAGRRSVIFGLEQQEKAMKKVSRCCCFLIGIAVLASTAQADEVTDWNQMLQRAALITGTSPLVMNRSAAIVQAAMFDAVNGVDPHYTSIYVQPAALKGTSARAAAVQAAYATLVKLFPTQQSALDARLAISIGIILNAEKKESVALGMQWGQTVAEAILAKRSTDGFTPAPPPFLGSQDVGKWRPTPPAFAPGAGPQFAYMTPWVIPSPSQFRPNGPAPLTSERYTADFNEVDTMGSFSSPIRTLDQTVFAFFWASTNTNYFWNRIAQSLIESRSDENEQEIEHGDTAHGNRNSLLRNARLFALMNLAMADAGIACWDAKYFYVFWRPVTAIRLGDTDGNEATKGDPAWMPLFATPPHPEYPAGHACVSSAAAGVLEQHFGKNTHFSVDSDGLPGVIRSFRSFSAAVDEVKNARIFAGIHFRSSTDDGQTIGINVSRYVLDHALQPVN
jgi:hypothetical protein